MTKNEFITQLTNELNRRKVADFADVVEEYEQHFAFKLADGYSEEEIAAKLGDPAVLAAQFGETDTVRQKSGNKPLMVVGLCFADLFAGLFFMLLAAWGVVMACRFPVLACNLPFGRAEYIRPDSRHALLVRRNSGAVLYRPCRIDRCWIYLLCGVPAPARALFWTFPA